MKLKFIGAMLAVVAAFAITFSMSAFKTGDAETVSQKRVAVSPVLQDYIWEMVTGDPADSADAVNPANYQYVSDNTFPGCPGENEVICAIAAPQQGTGAPNLSLPQIDAAKRLSIGNALRTLSDETNVVHLKAE